MNTETGSGPVGLIRVEAASYREALREISSRYGDEVRIVHTRVVRRKGVKGLLGVTGVEVYVADRRQYDAWRERGGAPPDPSPVPEPSSPGSARASVPGAPRGAGTGREHGETAHAMTNSALGAGAGRVRPDVLAAYRTQRAGGDSPAGHEVLARLEELQEHMRVLLRTTVSAGLVPSAGESGSLVVGGRQAPTSSLVHPLLAAAQGLLDAQGFAPEASRELLGELSLRQLPGTSGDLREVETLARIQLAELIRPKIPPCVPITLEAPVQGGGPRVVVLVGPTGVGKTTTIAKLASPLTLARSRRVGLLTLDTYRIGAVEQLKRYAEILGVPLHVADPGTHLPAALNGLGACDVVFVDTAGRSQRDAARLAEIRAMLQQAGEVQTHLCVSLTSSRETLLDVVRGYGLLDYDRVLVTKVDEAPRGGGLFDLLRATRVPVSYLTCGQEVPDDIQAASVDRLLTRMLGS